jgi:5'-3' exonuclease
LSAVIEYIKSKYKYVTYPGLEADDVMGYLGTSPEIYDPVIVSIDKDMMTVPTKIFNPDKMRRPVRVNKGQADILMFKQAITGDSTDNYKGIPGVGPVKADKIISESPQNGIWNSVLQAFLDNKLTTEYAITMVRLARILRYEDYDAETGEVHLWHPVTREQMTPSALNTTNSETESKSSTSSKPSAEDSPETKQSTLETASNTSVATETKKTESRRRGTSRKRSGTSSEQSKDVKKEENEDANT